MTGKPKRHDAFHLRAVRAKAWRRSGELVFAANATSLSGTGSYTLSVRALNTAPVLTLPPDQTVHAQKVLSANATACDGDLPAQTMVFSLVAGPVGLTVSPSGLVAWTSDDTQLGTASVTVVARPSLSIASVTSSNVTLSWTAIPGHNYRVQKSSDLGANDWTDMGSDITASTGTASRTDSLT